MVLGLVRMNVGNTRKLGDDLVDPWVVLHRARPERVESGVNTEVPLGEPRVVADHFRF